MTNLVRQSLLGTTRRHILLGNRWRGRRHIAGRSRRGSARLEVSSMGMDDQLTKLKEPHVLIIIWTPLGPFAASAGRLPICNSVGRPAFQVQARHGYHQYRT